MSDNKTIEAAREFLQAGAADGTLIDGSNAPELLNDFATEQVTAALREERQRVAERLRIITQGRFLGSVGVLLKMFIAELLEETR